ncbi:MAG: FAD binding domain-containing protein [Tagaea sp.]|nr:FAD binding domain-containing protein [Tagaea sp.]
MASWTRPSTLSGALAALAEKPRVLLAGGTDFYPARVGKPLDDDVLDVTAIEGLDAISRGRDGWRISARVTWSDLIAADLPPEFDALKAAAREIGGVQIQNAGTLAGNICNASPAADGVPPLLALDASVELASLRGTRVLKLAEFVLGNRKTARHADELVTAILVPDRPARSAFLKLGSRKYLVISIVMVAANVETDGGTVRAARVAVGACSAAAQRLPALEAALTGAKLLDMAKIAAPEHLSPLTPIDDVRGTAEYRRDAALVCVKRVLEGLA